MRRVYSTLEHSEVEYIAEILEREGIPVLCQNTDPGLTNTNAHYGAASPPEVWVLNDRDEARARAVIEQVLSDAARSHARGPWRCPRCDEEREGQFDSCWSCGAPR